MDDGVLVPLDRLEEAAACLRTLAHPVRLRMVQMLLSGEHTVGELAQACEVSSPVASEHLGLLRDRGLLGNRRDGRRVFYFVTERSLEGLLLCIQARYGAECRAPVHPDFGMATPSTLLPE